MNYREYLQSIEDNRNSSTPEVDKAQNLNLHTGGFFKNKNKRPKENMAESNTVVASVSMLPEMAAHTIQRHRTSCTYGTLRYQSQRRGKYPVLRQPKLGETDSDVEQENAFQYY